MILGKLFEKRSHPRNSDAWLINGWSGTETASGTRVDVGTAMQASAVYACVRVLAETVAMLPLITYRRLPGGGKERATDHPLFKLLHTAPNSRQTSFEWREMVMGNLSLRGNHYNAIIFNQAGVPAQILPLKTDEMEPRETVSGRLIYLNTATGQRFPADQILHIKALSTDGLVGISPIEQARETIGVSLATQEYGARFFSNSASPRGALQTDGILDDEEFDNVVESWNAAYSGVKKAHKVALLENGLKWQSIGMTSEDAQFLETRKFQVSEIARIFRVQPHLIGDLEKATFTNISDQSREFMVFTMESWLCRLEQAFSRALIPAEDRDDIVIEFLREGVLRGDPEARAKYYSALFNLAAISPNEIREKENRNPYSGGDERYIQVNMAPVGQPVTTLGRSLRPVFEDAFNRLKKRQVLDTPGLAKKGRERLLLYYRGDFMNFALEVFAPVFCTMAPDRSQELTCLYSSEFVEENLASVLEHRANGGRDFDCLDVDPDRWIARAVRLAVA